MPDAIVLELDDRTWQEYLNRTGEWLDNLLMAQATFRQAVEDTVPKIAEPHLKQALADMADSAREHEAKVDELYHLIGHDPAEIRKSLGLMMAKAGEVLTGLQGLLGGTTRPWAQVHGLLLGNMNSLGAFAVAEQLGLALGMPSLVDVIVPIVHEKQTHHLLLQEYMLEMAPISILYKLPFGDW